MASRIKKRIAFFLPDLRIGGAEKVFVQLANCFCENGYSVDLLLSQKVGSLFSTVSDKVDVISFSQRERSRLLLLLISIYKLFQYVRRDRPDVVFSTITGANLVAVVVKLLLPNQNTKFVLREASSFHNSGALYRWLSGVLYSRSDCVIAGSKGVLDDLVQRYKVDQKKAFLVRNPINTIGIKSLACEKTVHPWLENNAIPLIVSVGRLTPAKDLFTLVCAFGMVRRKVEARLIVIGDGECRSELEREVKELGLEQDIDFLGIRENPYPYMRHADLFVLSSRWEGFPNVILEALTLGCRIVSTECHAGPKEILTGIDGCMLVPVADAEQMAESVVVNLNGRLDLKEVESRLQMYSIQAVSKQYFDLVNGF